MDTRNSMFLPLRTVHGSYLPAGKVNPKAAAGGFPCRSFSGRSPLQSKVQWGMSPPPPSLDSSQETRPSSSNTLMIHLKQPQWTSRGPWLKTRLRDPNHSISMRGLEQFWNLRRIYFKWNFKIPQLDLRKQATSKYKEMFHNAILTFKSVWFPPGV